MTQAKVKFTTFEDYLSYSDETPMEGRYEFGNCVVQVPILQPNDAANRFPDLVVG